MYFSKTARKQQAKELEELAMELATLSPAELTALPADEPLKTEIREVRGLQGGSRKRQVKYIARTLRQLDPEPLFNFLTRKRGSKLEKDRVFHDLERLRDAIIAEAIDGQRLAMAARLVFPEPDWQCEALQEAVENWPDLDRIAVRQAAIRFALTRKPAHKKEIFRQLKAALERRQFAGKEG
jgi:ribosome-associated protein